VNIYAMKKPRRVNAVSVSLVGMALVIGYLGYAFIPIFWPIFQLQGILRGACNEAYRVHDDEKVMRYVVREAQRTGLPLSKDNFRIRRERYPEDELVALLKDVRSQDRASARELYQSRGKTCVIEYRYAANHQLPILGIDFPWTHQGAVRGTLETVQF
jgi:hypothetical protein